MKTISLVVALLLVGCATTTDTVTVEPKEYNLGSVTTRYMAAADVDRECSKRFPEIAPSAFGSGKLSTRWGCAIYDKSARSCTIIAKEPVDKIDWDRHAIIGIELWNCNRMARNEPS